VGQESPGTAATHDVEDGIEDLAQGVYPGTSGRSRGREMGLCVGPLSIGGVRWVCLFRACYSSESLQLDPFRTVSEGVSLLKKSLSGRSADQKRIQHRQTKAKTLRNAGL
jgi:hypothetical protein